MKRTILALFLFLSLGQALSRAQIEIPAVEKARRAYSLDMYGGVSFGFFSVNGEDRTALGSASGGNVSYRLTRFFRNGYGIYARIGSQGFSASDENYFGAVNRADGKKYLYRSSSSDYSRNYYMSLTVGGAYSFDFSRYSIRPRVGIGFAERDPLYFSYERRSRDGASGPQYFTYESASRKAPKVDYLLDNYAESISTTTPVLDAGVQLIFSPRSFLSFFVEAGLMADLSRMQVEKTVVGSKKAYEPSNWVEASSFYGSKDAWTRDNSSSKMTYDPFVPAPMLSLSAGISINFGKFNR